MWNTFCAWIDRILLGELPSEYFERNPSEKLFVDLDGRYFVNTKLIDLSPYKKYKI